VKEYFFYKFTEEINIKNYRLSWFPEVYHNKKSDSIVALYAMGGKGNLKIKKDAKGNIFHTDFIAKIRQTTKTKNKKDYMLVNDLLDIIYKSFSVTNEDMILPEKLNFALLLDTDGKDISVLKTETINDYKVYFPNFDNLNPSAVNKTANKNYGYYLFHKDLEDILIELFTKHQDNIFEHIDEYLEKSPANTKKEIDKDKAKISIVGQFQKDCTGYSNSVIIRDSNYINIDNLKTSDECIKIVKFLSDLMEIDHV
jgi:hypothetical protein